MYLELEGFLVDDDESLPPCCVSNLGFHVSGNPPADQLAKEPATRRAQRKSLTSYLTKLARLGGYLARVGDAPPGNRVVWKGLSRLTDIEMGFLIGAKLVGN